jgi:predicted nucleic acid-binding protein
MKIGYFLDTNVLLYAALGRVTEEAKRVVATDLISRSNFGISTQVLQEFYVAATRPKPLSRVLTPLEARDWIADLDRQPCAVVDKALIEVAIDISQRYRINYRDGAILAAAERLGAEIVYTEDLNHGQSYGPVRAVNPFV